MVSEYDFLHMYYIDFGDFLKFVLHGSVTNDTVKVWSDI